MLGFGDVLCCIWRFFRIVATIGVQTLLKAESEAIKKGPMVNDVFITTLKPTIGTILSATGEEMASKLT